MKKLPGIIALLTACSFCFGQNLNKLITQTDVTHIISTLAADDMQGRATFTPGIEKAARFIESEFKQTGLITLSGNTGYRQNFTLTKITPEKTLISINGKLLPADSAFADAETPINWSNNKDIEVAKITADKDFRSQYTALKKSGKNVLVFIDPQFTAIFNRIRNVVQKGAISTGAGKAMVVVLGNQDDLKSFEVTYTTRSQVLPLFNIAGMIKGKTRPDEYVIFSGHYDHLAIVNAVKGDSIANGADDDASGTTAVIELAKYFKKLNNNARSLIFVAFTAEEIGEFGSQHFATTVDPPKVTAMFNIEMIGKLSKFGENSAFITGYERSDFGAILQKNLAGTAFKFYPDPYPAEDLFYRSDNASLARVGVPAHTISTDQIDTDKLYHTVSDEVSTLDMANITNTIRAIALSSGTIVSGKDTPSRIAKLER